MENEALAMGELNWERLGRRSYKSSQNGEGEEEERDGEAGWLV